MDIWNLSTRGTDLEVKHEENEHYQFDIGILHRKKVVVTFLKTFLKFFTNFYHWQAALLKLKPL